VGSIPADYFGRKILAASERWTVKFFRKFKMSIVDATHASVGIVAFFAAVISYTHIRDLAIRNGYDHFTSYLLPLSVDGLIVGASLMLVLASRERLRVPLARCALWLGIGATIAANVAFGTPESLTGPAMRATVCAWPAIAFIMIVEAWMQLKKHRRITSKTEKVAKPTRRDLKATKSVETNKLTRETQQTEATQGERDLGVGGSVEHRPAKSHRRGRKSAVNNIGTAEMPDYDGLPTPYRIAEDLGCGHAKSVQLRDIMRDDNVNLETALKIRAERPFGRKGKQYAGTQ
jgi:hypothetical protein